MTYKKLTQEEKQRRKEERQFKKVENKSLAQIQEERNQRPIKSITISIEWRKSHMWGFNPHAEAKIEYKKSNGQDGGFERRNGYTCGGCGYDKKSTVIAQIFNDFLKYKL